MRKRPLWKRLLPIVAATTSLYIPRMAAAGQSPEPPASWLLSAGAEVGQDDSHGYAVSAEFASQGDRFGVALAGQQSTAPATATGSETLDSTSGQAVMGVRWGAAHFELGVDTTRDADLRRSERLSGAVSLGWQGWNARAGVSRRHTDFDDLPVEATITLRNGATFALSGVVSCEMQDTGYELGLGYGAEAWDAYVSGQWASFDSLRCGYTNNVPPELRRIASRLFSQFAGQRSRLLTQRIGGRIGQKSALLDSLYGAGIARHFDTLGVAFDYTRSEATFDESVQDGYAVTGTWLFGERASADLTLGTTLQDGDTAPYAGLQLSYRW